MSAELSKLHIALVTLETLTPLSLSTGASDPLFDTMLARDVNELPMIPGTSVAGVLRHLYTAAHGREKANALFGLDAEAIADRARKRDKDPRSVRDEFYQASFLHVSAALLHGSHDRPVTAAPTDEAELKDDLLAHALAPQPIQRDHVRLTDRGVADTDERGKFTRAALARGNRFTFELALWSEQKSDLRWEQLRRLFAHAAFRLGGGTRRGFGAVEVKRWRERVFDMCDKQDAGAYCAFQTAGDLAGFASTEPVRPDSAAVQATLLLEPEDFFRFGGGDAPLRQGNEKPPTLLPLSERCIVWQTDAQGRTIGKLSQDRAAIPASAIKGALRHRIAFHFNRSAKNFLGKKSDKEILAQNAAADALFGRELQRDGTDPNARAGQLIVSDLLLDELDAHQDIGWMTHNSIDRFSGGTRHGVLYSEELLFRCSFKLTVTILQPDDHALRPRDVRGALHAALKDLAEGRLALGAGASKGHGYFTAPAGVVWSDDDAWIHGRSA